MAVGMPSISTRTSLSWPVSRLKRPRRATTADAVPATGPATDEPCTTVRSAIVAHAGYRAELADENRLLLVFDGLQQSVDVVGFVDELLERRDHHSRREVRPRIPIQELGDVL